MHVAPCRQGAAAQSSTLASQSRPVHPARQVHAYAPTVLLHAAAFTHGVAAAAHSSTSATDKAVVAGRTAPRRARRVVELTFLAGGAGPAGRAVAREGGEAVAAAGAVAAGCAGAVVQVAVAQRAAPAALADAAEAGAAALERARAVGARLRRARVVDVLAVVPGEALGAAAAVLVGCRVLARAAVLARLVRAAVVQVYGESERGDETVHETKARPRRDPEVCLPWSQRIPPQLVSQVQSQEEPLQ